MGWNGLPPAQNEISHRDELGGSKEKEKTMEKQEFINYLTETLIPDLMNSGHVTTAQDFMRAVWFLENPDAEEVHDNDLPPTL